jgi:hypothetical protein
VTSKPVTGTDAAILKSQALRVFGTKRADRFTQPGAASTVTSEAMPRTVRKPAGALVVADQITRQILLLRGQRVLLSPDLASLYGVENRALIQAVKRNRERFPEDFMFVLTSDEAAFLKSQSVISTPVTEAEATILKSQTVISSSGWGGRRHTPYAFTEQGVAMLSSVLRSPRAVAVNVEIMRAFVRLRQLLSTHADLARKLTELERTYDAKFRVVFDAIRQLMEPVEEAGSRPAIGFR